MPVFNTRAGNIRPYTTSPSPTPVDLKLSGNEGPAPSDSLWGSIARRAPELARRYPCDEALRLQLAQKHDRDAGQVVITAGGDDAIDRLCRLTLAGAPVAEVGVSEPPEVVLPVPTFEMIGRYATLCGGLLVEVPWPEGAYPTDAVVDAISERTALVVMVSPNNPTGAVASRNDLERIARAAPNALVLLDQAYAEFSDEELTRSARDYDNVVVIRTLSKAWGLAGLRVGYALASGPVAERLRAVGPPYAVSSLSLALASEALGDEARTKAFVTAVKSERSKLTALLDRLNLGGQPSAANFVLATPPDAAWLRDGLAGQGIGVRHWPDDPQLCSSVRITCPGDPDDFRRLERALMTVASPQALLFDMDGVLVDVSESYRRAIVQTAASFGVRLSARLIEQAKRRGLANDDWALTRALLSDAGVDADLEEVTARFEALYQGTDTARGLWQSERPLIDSTLLRRLKAKLPLAVVTGRPRRDAESAIERFGWQDLFDAVVCREDAPLKPEPAPVILALRKLGFDTPESGRAWMIGDTVDDIRAARGAGVLPLGFQASADNETFSSLLRAGAGRVFRTWQPLEEFLS